MKYDFQKIEKKWQKKWEEAKLWHARDNSKKPKYYALIEFPYPSGDGLHVGHIRSNTAMDIIARKRRMEGHNVLYPIGWDAFGLPTENYAIKTGTAPHIVTKKNTENFRRQLKSLGFSFDWNREINTSDPRYYKWTQWIFLQFFKKGLAYKATTTINWCLSCKIGLANEEAVGGRCERCEGEIEQRVRKQWMLKITAYADKLIEGLDSVDFLENIKTQQKNWIGKSVGRLISFTLKPSRGSRTYDLHIFTTRPDTIDGVTYMVCAPEHPIIEELLREKVLSNAAEVKEYLEKTRGKTDLERQENKDKTGVELKGIKAINDYNKEKIPVWISDYVLAHYATGAVMAVPAHDKRDEEFAKKFRLKIKNAPLVPEKKWLGEEQVHYKLRDWVFSRQRYWGEPIPLIECSDCGFVPVPEKNLPVELPRVRNYEPRDDGQSPLASVKAWVEVTCPRCKKKARRETDTMPNWAGSSWYFMRYIDPHNTKHFADVKKLAKMMPIDWYNGGMEHVTLHLLYSRFWNLFMHDEGLVPYSEPYKKRTAHGLVLGEGGIKMSKSKGNVINPDGLIKIFGADSLRLYEMFMGPFSEMIPWDPQGIVGMYRFLNRIYDMGEKLDIKSKKDRTQESVKDDERLLHKTIKKVTEDIEEMHFNTAISALMIYFSHLEKKVITSTICHDHFMTFLTLLFPFAPHLSQELWEKCHKKGFLDQISWPVWDEQKILDSVFNLVIQINGKVRAIVKTRTDISEEEAAKLACAEKKIIPWIRDQQVKKIIFIPNRLINIIL